MGRRGERYLIPEKYKFFIGMLDDGRIVMHVASLTDQEKAILALTLDGCVSMFTKNLDEITGEYKLWLDWLRERRPEIFQEVKE